MALEYSTSDRLQLAGHVRRNAGSAAFAALCLLYFGFLRFDAPKVTDLFTAGDAVFNYTLRCGGVAMAGIALWSLFGRVTVLIVDAVASVAIGVLLAMSAAMMIFGGGGRRQILYIVFGAMFVAAGIRNWRDYMAIVRRAFDASGDPYRNGAAGGMGSGFAGSPRGGYVSDDHSNANLALSSSNDRADRCRSVDRQEAVTSSAATTPSLASRLRARSTGKEANRVGNREQAESEPPPSDLDDQADESAIPAPEDVLGKPTTRARGEATDDHNAESQQEPDSPPSGYLAALGKKPPPRQG